ncbi:MAG: tautomerase family protein [Proteobacteria bacterium]|nr:tautomerase family protein [Pseudomonadota bacterium]
MPIALIEIRKTYSKDQEIALMQAVHSAIQEAFKILNNDIHIRLLAHEPHRFSVPVTNTNPPLYPHPELYTQITIDCFPGRSLDAKRDLYRRIVENLETHGIPKDHVKIILKETSKENWGIRNGQPACDIDVGYAIEV